MIATRTRLTRGELPAPNVEYYWRRTVAWRWDGEDRWWEVFVVFNGMNGGGGACIEERWRWNRSAETLRRPSRNLTVDETRQLISELWGDTAEGEAT